ncbi:MAG: type 1 glutamine amidotransferase [Gammaproteobacteria bacterium]|nr:MAG: type 1 glutamine amidotransferase [Gammaproteobacteria bacterium]
MNVHYLQHVPFEGLGSMENWFRAQNHSISATHLYAGETLPTQDNFDWLVVMGGPMGVNDEQEYPWLAEEKRFIRETIDAGKRVLGICLGAQLIADALGAAVTRNPLREIGWFPITVNEAARTTAIGTVLRGEPEVFHWHGDRFAIPDGATPLASSIACDNQGFLYDDRVLGLQFHLETTEQSARDLSLHCGNELDGSEFVQSTEQMLSQPERFTAINRLMTTLLEVMADETSTS